MGAFLVPSECPRSGDEKRLSGSRPDNLSDEQRMWKVSVGWRVIRSGYVPSHANALAEHSGETRRHVRDGWVGIGIENL